MIWEERMKAERAAERASKPKKPTVKKDNWEVEAIKGRQTQLFRSLKDLLRLRHLELQRVFSQRKKMFLLSKRTRLLVELKIELLKAFLFQYYKST
jgi:hypothetical protein